MSETNQATTIIAVDGDDRIQTFKSKCVPNRTLLVMSGVLVATCSLLLMTLLMHENFVPSNLTTTSNHKLSIQKQQEIDRHYNSIHLRSGHTIHTRTTRDHFSTMVSSSMMMENGGMSTSSLVKLFQFMMSPFYSTSTTSQNSETHDMTTTLATTATTEGNDIKTFFLHFHKHFYDRIAETHQHSKDGCHSKEEFHWLQEQAKKFTVRLGHYLPQRTFMISGSEKNVLRLKEYLNREMSSNSNGWFSSIGTSEEVCWIGLVDRDHKSVPRDVLEVHLDKTVVVERVMRGDLPYDDAFRYLTRKLLSNEDKGKDVHFVIMVTMAKHESKEELELNEISNVNSPLMKLVKENSEDDNVSVKAVSNEKIAIGVNGHQHALKLAEKLKEHGLVHWVEIKTPTIIHGRYSNALVQSYKKPTDKPIWGMGLTGSGQVIGVGDTGVDYYHCFFYDDKSKPPFQRNLRDSVQNVNHRKFASFWTYMDALDSPMGHGTHVTGIAAGSTHPSAIPADLKDHDALAKDAKLAFLDAGCDSDDGCSCPSDTLCECDMKDGKKCPKKFGVVYLPLDLYASYFPYFYQNGAKVVSSSWGTGFFKDFGFGYSTNSREIDQFAWEKKDFLPVFAAGNSGGVFGYASLTSEAEAKNTLSIGASLSTLQSFQQSLNITSTQLIIDRLRIELYQKFCLKASDLYDPDKCEKAKNFQSENDCCATSCKTVSTECCGVQDFSPFLTIGFRCCPQCIGLEMQKHPEYYSQENLAVFTARGPTLDGRIKPDVVTVGEKILSSLSAGTTESKKCGTQTNIRDQMVYHEGTSMAAPLAAGAAALVRQFYQEGYLTGSKNPSQGFNPSAALVKATLIHSSKPLTGYVHLLSKHQYWPLQYQEGHTFSLQSTYMQGFGHIDLSNVMDKSMGLYVPNRVDSQLTTGQTHQYCLNVKSQGDNPLKVTVVWTDPPSSPAAKIHLINDLDLVVITPKGDKLFGNGGKSSVKQTRAEPDQLNNVEQVELDKLDPVGLYNIVVRGNAVTKGPQPYAIVMTGNFELSTGCSSYSFIPYAYLAERVETYSNLSIAFGLLAIICIPALAFLSIYLYLQYRAVTTSQKGYREAAIGRNTNTYVDLGDDDNYELKNVKKNYIVDDEDDNDEDNIAINKRGGTAREKAELVERDNTE
ncbi:hypothetical protein C9374_001257 [Naegleria lovaniensis]|uniref:Peptidase S8/S53 domain-containing protein n=1 Tax=Naegleria lovaniensis TaxID=51637 RepID=A0AA88GWJ6_NAELO|nr:uncharacterized protein C9374_001257 [Naegleria lovaniensis]KAG2387663.1 hypothetical protein C9374_001257 [Naegleria lovaniensis]